MLMNNSTKNLDQLVLRITIWAETQARLVLENGRPLDGFGFRMAIGAGVQHPEEVLLLTVSKMPTSEDVHLRQALEQFSIVTPSTKGLTIGYNVFLLQGSSSNRQLAHQLKHVVQFERCRGIPGFFEKYISEVNEYGSARAPLEAEALAFRGHEFLAQ
jgi:hypothetical protein